MASFKAIFMYFLLALLDYANGGPFIDNDVSFVASRNNYDPIQGHHGHIEQVKRMKRELNEQCDPDIQVLHVVSVVMSRFAQTTITASIENKDDLVHKEIKIRFKMADTAFISNFTVEDGLDRYIGKVEERDKAEQEFLFAKRSGQTAGMVRSDDDVEHGLFSINLNVRPKSAIFVALTYQQLLSRHGGTYSHVISLRPHQVTAVLSYEIHLYEKQEFKTFDVKWPIPLDESVNIQHNLMDVSKNFKSVSFHANCEGQQVISDSGINQDLVIEYDVVHGSGIGQIQFDSEYFVHFFSPDEEALGLKPLAKNIVFVIDNSGSMFGEKLNQTRAAMISILDQLNPADHFLLTFFDDKTNHWPASGKFSKASTKAITSAKTFIIDSLIAYGGTNINDALVMATSYLRSFAESMATNNNANIILFLTDGHPTVSETIPTVIIDNIMKVAEKKVTIFSLGFGSDLNYNLIQTLAYRTGGFAKKIYPGLDAFIQLQSYIEEINTPVLYDVNIQYDSPGVDADSLTDHNANQYFKGSEMVVAGKFVSDETPETVGVKITGTGLHGESKLELAEEVKTAEEQDEGIPSVMQGQFGQRYLEKLFVYMKIHHLLKQELRVVTKQQKQVLRAYTLSLAMEYNLVTPLTSMIIVLGDSNQGQSGSVQSSASLPQGLIGLGMVADAPMDLGSEANNTDTGSHEQDVNDESTVQGYAVEGPSVPFASSLYKHNWMQGNPYPGYLPQRPGGPPSVGPPITSWKDGMPGAAPQNRGPALLPSAPGLQPPLRWGQGSVGNGPPGVHIPSRPGDNGQGYPASPSPPTTVDNNDPATTAGPQGPNVTSSRAWTHTTVPLTVTEVTEEGWNDVTNKDIEEPSTTTGKPSTTTGKLSTPTEKPSTTTEQPSTTTEKSGMTTVKLSTTTKQPSTTTRTLSTTTKKPSTTTKQPSTTTRTLSTTTEKPSTTTKQPSTTTRTLSTTTGKPSTTRQEKEEPPIKSTAHPRTTTGRSTTIVNKEHGCSGAPCNNGSQCMEDHVTTMMPEGDILPFLCHCQPDWSGPTCHIENACEEIECSSSQDEVCYRTCPRGTRFCYPTQSSYKGRVCYDERILPIYD